MNSTQIRRHFLDFFASKSHLIVPSAPLVIKNDPTLMFTNAGMNQFKDFFLGNKQASTKRIADTQKCLRVSGKHNDLEDVGLDTFHHTMFEMLGNWSFGDYFKNEAIAWAWELLTEVYKLPKDRLYVTVFEGDAKEKLDFDRESYDIWKQFVTEDHILRGNKKDNFWEMGDTGPCGPCSEIHIDLRDEAEIAKIPGQARVNNDDPQVIEIWNNVFIQYNRKADGSLELLPDKHVDTGMGFERLVRVIQGKKSNYDTDVFQPQIQFLENLSGLAYTQGEAGNSKVDIAMRVIADHIRAIAFAIADGQLPSNAKAGYVIRRILRRAVRYGYTFLNLKEPFLYQLVSILSDQFEDVFPELHQQKAFISNVIREEETSFLRTLENGITRLNAHLEVLNKSSNKVVEGKIVFELYDTYGFPVDLTSLIARENGYSIDEIGFESEMERQKERSRAASSSESGDWIQLKTIDGVDFVGYDMNIVEDAVLVKYREVKQKEKKLYQIVLDRTPFYAESGGQIGDSGILQYSIQGQVKSIKIFDTKKENDLIIHLSTEHPGELVQTHNIVAKIDAEKRLSTRNNHSATHLLQAALRQLLGDHIAQKGSFVSHELLRFDFSHFAKLTTEEISKIENIVNRKIQENIALNELRNVPIQKALEMGATALFGEKYGDFVRVIQFDSNFSTELCGGTHAAYTGNIGYFKIVSEGSVAAGVRRIEAITGQMAETFIQERLLTLASIEEVLKNSKDPLKTLQNVLDEKSALQKKIEKIEEAQIALLAQSLKTKIDMKGGVAMLLSEVSVPNNDALKTLCFQLRNETPALYTVLTAIVDEKPLVHVALSDDLVAKGHNAKNIVNELAKEIQGGGGGQAFYASAGGKNKSGLINVLAKAKTMIA